MNTDLLSGATRHLGGGLVHFIDQVLQVVVGLRNCGGVERVRLHNVAAGLKVLLMT